MKLLPLLGGNLLKLSLGSLLLTGCLKSDFQTGQLAESNNNSPVKEQLPMAPAEIDPVILFSRAFKEAPMLKIRVEAGELPPVFERLPENPLVIVPVENIGHYGGSLRRTLQSDINDETAVRKTLSESLMGYEGSVLSRNGG